MINEGKYKAILNYGGGVGSTAMLVNLFQENLNGFNRYNTLVVFSDTGVEKSWTYEYVSLIQELCLQEGVSFEIVKPKMNLEEMIYHSGILPSRLYRWCTEKMKIRPIRKRAIENDIFKKYTQLIGFDSDELNRVPKHPKYENCTERYPLIELNQSRIDCINTISSFGIDIPRKSSCFCCPFQRLSTFVEYVSTHPEELERVRKMEYYTNLRRKEMGKVPFYLFKESVDSLLARSESIIERAKKRGTYYDDYGLIQNTNETEICNSK